MATLSWGKPTIETAASSNGAPDTDAGWKAIAVPKDTTTKLTTTAGSETEALEEGGDLVDSRIGKNKYQFEFDHFVKKGVKRPWDDVDGIIAGEHAFRLTPEDEECEGIQIDRSTLHVEESYSTTDGIMLHYVAKVLKPKEGKMVKPYFKNQSV
ncbi:MAG: hypothetical protein ACI4BC_05180 [Muribaculaceae bacterium]